MSEVSVDEAAALRRLCELALRSVRHSMELGMRLENVAREGVTLRLPHAPHLVGNPWNGVVHGGPLLALLDHAGGLAAACRLYPEYDITPTLDLRIDHLRRPEAGVDFLAFAECYRMTSQVAFVRGCAYQADRDNPVSTFVATYMRLGLKRGAGKKP